MVVVAGYENLLALVYHVSLPLLGCQAMFLEIFDVSRDCRVVHSSTLPLSPNARIRWFGFSEEGLLLSLDDAGILRAFVGLRRWEIVWDASARKKGRRPFWMVGMRGFAVIGADLASDDFEPAIAPRPALASYPLRFPVQTLEKEALDEKYQKMLLLKLRLEHEKFRAQHWAVYKEVRDRTHRLYSLSESIKDEEDIEEEEEQGF